MTDNQVAVAMEHFAPYLPKVPQTLRPKLQAANEDCMAGLMKLKLKNPTTAILLSVFLGIIGAGRFYLGDKKLGVWHIITTILLIALNIFPYCIVATLDFFISILILDAILWFANYIWVLVDIFLVAKKAKWDNYAIVVIYLTRYTVE